MATGFIKTAQLTARHREGGQIALLLQQHPQDGHQTATGVDGIQFGVIERGKLAIMASNPLGLTRSDYYAGEKNTVENPFTSLTTRLFIVHCAFMPPSTKVIRCRYAKEMARDIVGSQMKRINHG